MYHIIMECKNKNQANRIYTEMLTKHWNDEGAIFMFKLKKWETLGKFSSGVYAETNVPLNKITRKMIDEANE